MDSFDHLTRASRSDVAGGRVLRAFQAGEPVAVRPALCDVVPGRVRIHVYHSLGFEQDIDAAVGMIDDIAFALFVPVFLHFCLRYPVRSEVLDAKPWKTYALYVPAIVLSLSTVVVFGLPL